MMKHLPFLLTLLPFTATAQGWVVNEPVEVQLSAITVYGGGCFPAIQAQLSFGQPPLAGVTYYYKVISITTDGAYTMVPGPAQPLAVNDLIPVQQYEHQVYNSGTFGGLELEVWAIGTPTIVGQPHPCAPSELWMSNLLLCNEGLTCMLTSNCFTELGTGLADASAAATLVLPTASNGFTLQWTGAAVQAGAVLDLGGRVVHTLASGMPTAQLAHLPTGLYVLHLEASEGTAQRQVFPIVH